MKKLITFSILIGVLLSMQTPVVLGHHDQNCQEEFYRRSLDVITQYVAQGELALEQQQDLEGVYHRIESVQQIAATILSLCAGLSLNSDTDGLTGTFGPLNLPAGPYRMQLITNGAFAVSVVPIEGNCDSGLVLEAEAGAAVAPDGVEDNFMSGNCLAMLEITRATDPWTFKFEHMTLIDDIFASPPDPMATPEVQP
jgi:hypothetical protein